jgi:DNA-binding XRE family transcriptional regulator
MKRVVKTAFPGNPQVLSPETLGTAIRACRTEQGLTIEQAALTIGVAKQTLSDIEAGKPTVGLGIALRVAAELGVSVFVARTRDLHRISPILAGVTK